MTQMGSGTARAAVALALAFAGASVALADAPSFQGLGDLPGGAYSSAAFGISPNGSTIVGHSSSGTLAEACRWTSGGPIQPLGHLSGAVYGSYAYGVSADGLTIVGECDNGTDYRAFRWTPIAGMVDLGDLTTGGNGQSEGREISANGSIIVGISDSDNGKRAFHCTLGAGMVSLGDLPGGSSYSAAYGISGNGLNIAGRSSTALGYQAFCWTDPNGNGLVDPGEELDYHPEFGLDDLPGGSFYGSAGGMSPDGSTIVGHSSSLASGSSGREACRWTSAGVMGLGDLPGGRFYSIGYGVSADGWTIVGQGDIGTYEYRAFIWDHGTMRNLRDVLVTDFGLAEELEGWTLWDATDISDDGLTITGYGFNPSGDGEAWVAHIVPEPGTLCLVLLGGTVALRRRR